MREHLEWFKAYANKKIHAENKDRAPLELKLLHTMNVLEKARAICADEGFSPLLSRTGSLAALYHDIARFEQYLRYRTFKDRESCNHALLGLKILKQEKRLDGEPEKIRHAIMAAVGLHNRFKLPAIEDGNMRLACQLVRDADKLDILRVMDIHLTNQKNYNPTVVLGLPDDSQVFSREVIAAAMSGRPCRYEDLKSVNDFKVLLGSWFFALYFDSARRIYIKDGHGRKLVESLPGNNIYGPVRQFLLAGMM